MAQGLLQHAKHVDDPWTKIVPSTGIVVVQGKWVSHTRWILGIDVKHKGRLPVVGGKDKRK